jgi:hypothetical protein
MSETIGFKGFNLFKLIQTYNYEIEHVESLGTERIGQNFDGVRDDEGRESKAGIGASV